MDHEDETQLRILGLLHYVGAALAGVIPLLGALYVALGGALILGKFPGGGPPAPGQAMGWLPLGMGVFAMLVGIVAVTLNLLTARSLRDRKNLTLCLLTSALNCVHLPLGTLLAALTLIVLSRPTVSERFRSEAPAPAPFPESAEPLS